MFPAFSFTSISKYQMGFSSGKCLLSTAGQFSKSEQAGVVADWGKVISLQPGGQPNRLHVSKIFMPFDLGDNE